MSKDNGVLSPEAAKKALMDDNKKRSDLCRKEMAQVLKKHNCSMDVVTIIRTGVQPVHQVNVIANG